MTTNRNEVQDLGRALRRSENEEISGSSVMSESCGEIRGYNGETEDRPLSENNLREVNIKPLDSGYLVKVGCQSVAVETTEALVKALNDYLTRPEAFERAWFKNSNRRKL